MALLWAGRPFYRLQFLAMSFSTAAMSTENIPCLVWISIVAMSVKIPYLKYASSHPGSLYATKWVMHRLQLSLSHLPYLSILEDQPITAQSLDRYWCHLTVAVNASFRPASPNCNRVADPVTVPSSICAGLPTPPLSCIESFSGVLTPSPATSKW